MLAEQELALVLVDGLVHRVADLLPDLEHLELARQHLVDGAQAQLDVQGLEQPLLVLGREVEERGDEVSEPARPRLLARGVHGLGGQVGDQGDDALELPHDLLDQRLGFDVVRLDLGQGLDARLEIGLVGRVLGDPHPARPLDQHREAVVGEADHAQHHAGGRDLVEIDRLGILGGRLLLAHDGHGAVAGHDVVQELDALLPADVERLNRERKQHRLPHRQHRQHARFGAAGLWSLGPDQDGLELPRRPGTHVNFSSAAARAGARPGCSISISFDSGVGARRRRMRSMPSL